MALVKNDNSKQIKKAQTKFKKVGANIRIAQYEQLEEHIANKGITMSAHVKGLLEDDLYGTTKRQIEKLNVSVETITKQRNELADKLTKALTELKAERSKTVVDKLLKR